VSDRAIAELRTSEKETIYLNKQLDQLILIR
jgi:hypothetical protein